MKPSNLTRSILAITLLMGVSACSSQRDKLTNELKAYGMHKDQAKCMAAEMDDQLSKNEMKSVNKVLHTGRDSRDARPSEVMRALKNIDDPYIVKAAVRSSVGCTLISKINIR